MVNKPKQKGTAAESAVVGFLRDNGWPHCERRALQGSLDKGDIGGCPALCFEVKHAGDNGLKLGPWLQETAVERVNARADFGVLVIKPFGVGGTRVGEWYAAMRADEFLRLEAQVDRETATDFHVDNATRVFVVHADAAAYNQSNLQWTLNAGVKRLAPNEVLALTARPPGMKENPDGWYKILRLEHMVRLLRAAGYGDPEPAQTTWSAGVSVQSPGVTGW